MQKFNYVNEIFKDELNDEFIQAKLLFAKKVSFFIDIILEHCSLIINQEYRCHINNSLYYGINYIKETHPDYYSELIRMYNNGEIHISNYSTGNADCDSYTGEIWLGLSKTILDDLYLVHEFFHHQNLIPINNGTKKKSITRELFGEAISIAAELDFSDKITNDDLAKDTKIFEIDYINDAVECARKIKTELILIDIYSKHGEINDNLITTFILENNNDIGELFSQEYESVLSDISGWGANLKFYWNLKYVLGIIFGYYLSDLVKENPENWKIIYDINSSIYDLSIEQFLKKIKINLEEDKIVTIFLEHYNKLNEKSKPNMMKL